MYVKLNMYDALTYVMGRTCLCRHVHARERCVWLHSRMFYLVRFVSLPRDARKQRSCVLLWSRRTALSSLLRHPAHVRVHDSPSPTRHMLSTRPGPRATATPGYIQLILPLLLYPLRNRPCKRSAPRVFRTGAQSGCCE